MREYPVITEPASYMLFDIILGNAQLFFNNVKRIAIRAIRFVTKTYLPAFLANSEQSVLKDHW